LLTCGSTSAYENNMALTIRNRRFYLDCERMLLVSGSVHYWRLDRSRWGEILDRVREMGFETICTYVPWCVHEISRGEFDFGEINPDYDLDAFLTLCEKKDMHVLLRPGPHVNSEITYFGFPKRIVHDPEIQSVTADGTPVIFPSPPRMFPVPSYASEKFYREVGRYFDRVAPIIRAHLHPHGGIIAVQADNELSFFLRTQPYDHDYSTGAIRLYARFLEEKYQDIRALNERYSTEYGSFDAVLPPRDFNCASNGANRKNIELPYYLDWIEYKEYYLQYGLSRIAEMLRERGVETLIYHNLPGLCTKPPYNHVRMEEIVDVVGFDLYYYKEEYHKVKRCVQYLNGISRAPFLSEFAAGFVALPIPVKPILLDDARFTTYAALMHGFSGINFYMLVERERWVGSPIDRFGGIRREHFKFYQEFNRILKRMDYQKLESACDGILLVNRDCARLELASSLLTPIPIIGGITPEYYVSEDDLGFSDIIQLECTRQWNALYFGFGAAKYPVAIGDTTISEERLAEYKMVAVPTFDFMSESVQKKLSNYARNGGHLVIGPRVPVLDYTMQKCNILEKNLLKPYEGLDRLDLNGAALASVDLFDIADISDIPDPGDSASVSASIPSTAPVPASLLAAEPGHKTLIYQQSIGSGTIIHFGFLFPRIAEPDHVTQGLLAIIERIATATGLDRTIPETDPGIDVAVQRAADCGREFLFVANTRATRRDVDVGGRYRDLKSGEVVGPVTTVPAYTVLILEADQR